VDELRSNDNNESSSLSWVLKDFPKLETLGLEFCIQEPEFERHWQYEHLGFVNTAMADVTERCPHLSKLMFCGNYETFVDFSEIDVDQFVLQQPPQGLRCLCFENLAHTPQLNSPQLEQLEIFSFRELHQVDIIEGDEVKKEEILGALSVQLPHLQKLTLGGQWTPALIELFSNPETFPRLNYLIVEDYDVDSILLLRLARPGIRFGSFFDLTDKDWPDLVWMKQWRLGVQLPVGSEEESDGLACTHHPSNWFAINGNYQRSPSQ
jgi:hypothetical protein